MSEQTPEPHDDEPDPPFQPLEVEAPKVDTFKKGADEGDLEKRDGG